MSLALRYELIIVCSSLRSQRAEELTMPSIMLAQEAAQKAHTRSVEVVEP